MVVSIKYWLYSPCCAYILVLHLILIPLTPPFSLFLLAALRPPPPTPPPAPCFTSQRSPILPKGSPRTTEHPGAPGAPHLRRPRPAGPTPPPGARWPPAQRSPGRARLADWPARIRAPGGAGRGRGGQPSSSRAQGRGRALRGLPLPSRAFRF